MLLLVKKAQYLCGVIVFSLVFIFAPGTSLNGQNKEQLNRKVQEQQEQLKKQEEQLKELDDLKKQFLWYSNNSRGSEILVQQELKEELSKNQKFMETIKELADALKMGYQGSSPMRNRNFIMADELSKDDPNFGTEVDEDGTQIYPGYMIWTHRNSDIVATKDTLPQRFFGNYADNIFRRYQKYRARSENKNYTSGLLSISDTSVYRAVNLLAAFKKDAYFEKSQELIARYPAYSSAIETVSSKKYVMTGRQWWLDVLDINRRNDFQWAETTDKGTKFNMGLSKPFVSVIAKDSSCQRILWIDIDLGDSSKAKMVLNIVLTRKEPTFAKTILKPDPTKLITKATKPIASVPPKQRKLALVIGNSNYRNLNSLFNPTNDVDSMSKVLIKLGFDVVSYKNLDYANIDQYIKNFADKASREQYDVILFYYSGHGVSMNNLNYIIPTDFPENWNKTDFKRKAVDMDWVHSSLSEDDLEGKTYITILDACRDDPFRRRTIQNFNPNVWFPEEPLPNSIIVYSASLGQTSCDGNGGNGCYTSVLLKYISECGSISALLNKVRGEMKKHQQEPIEMNKLTSEFYFKGPCKD